MFDRAHGPLGSNPLSVNSSDKTVPVIQQVCFSSPVQVAVTALHTNITSPCSPLVSPGLSTVSLLDSSTSVLLTPPSPGVPPWQVVDPAQYLFGRFQHQIDLRVATRMEVLQEHYQSQGFKRETARMIAHSRTEGTITTYQGKWECYMDFCIDNNLHPIHIDGPHLSDFFLSLFERGLARSTILGYRSVVSQTLIHIIPKNWGQDLAISHLLDYYFRERLVNPPQAPAWDLALVLEGLATLDNLTCRPQQLLFKTTFLLALATLRRRSEVNAFILHDIQHDEGEFWTFVTLRTDPLFVAKNETASNSSLLKEPVTIQALPAVDRSFCPVYCLQVYLNRFRRLRQNKRKLLISAQVRIHNDVRPNTTSTWLKRAIEMGYELTHTPLVVPHHAHQTRGLGASVMFHSGIPLQTVLDTARWKQHTTFTRSYLAPISHRMDRMLRLHRVPAGPTGAGIP